jgi:hypothetical protein
MSDGPHRSLPMRPGWKRVAECGDNHAFAPEEVSNAIIPALEQDCRAEMTPEFLDAFCDLYGSLFKDQLGPELEALRGAAGCGIGRIVLDHAIQMSANGETGPEAPVQALANALTDRAARGARQVEEHYCRESNEVRAQNVRARIEQGVGGADVDGLARRVLKRDSGSSAPPVKQQGLDDGVRL